jgi:ATP-dependent phosphofructokinase / diphosphate-dependent phosphofructokinase
MKKRCMVLTGGGDCPGLNAVIRAIVKRASREENWEIVGSLDAFNGIMKDPPELVVLNKASVAGIHVKGGTILGTTNKGGPFNFPVKQKDGTWTSKDRSDELIEILERESIHAVINIGGDGSQAISQSLFEKGVNIIGVPKTIDNDLMSTDFTFGFQTAVEIATDALDKLVTTAESHHRIMIMEVMGREAGWIALYTAIAGGAEICLLPEIPYNVDKLITKIKQRTNSGKGFVNIVIAEGAYPVDGEISSIRIDETGYRNEYLKGAGFKLAYQLKQAGIETSIRTTILGHIQRGGTPCVFDRVLATQFGVKAFELVLENKFGQMVSFIDNEITDVTIEEAIMNLNFVDPESYLVHTAKSLGIIFGD